jgi:hypothetical protein
VKKFLKWCGKAAASTAKMTPMPPITEPAMVALSPMLRPADPELGSSELDVP